MKFGLILVFLLLLIPFAMAELNDDVLKIKVYNSTKIDRTGGSLSTIKIEFVSTEFKGNNQNFTFTFNASKMEKTGIGFTSPDINFLVEGEIVNTDYLNEYIKCNSDLSRTDQGYTSCTVRLANYEGKNATACKEELQTCNLNLKEKDLDAQAQEDKITGLQDEKNNTQNSKWIYALIGAVVGAFGFNLYKQRGGPARERSMGEFNREQAG